ncbi:hypothetical protein AXF42_Ash001629 [Apostasia shenzhenica]|uniref:DUF4283 domain-containing protein n=1 Tax=Apostasia shenzhenica TaxID=1088818 RepID=A0A2I0AAS3_9ASPA|nr:hypothetical protein AXF42_Ash001629 [Apostasia shenzhenica]
MDAGLADGSGPGLDPRPDGPPGGLSAAQNHPSAAGPSFADVLIGPNFSSQPPSSPLQDIVPGLFPEFEIAKSFDLLNGMPAFIFSEEEIQTMSKPFESTMVGFFPKGRPSMDNVRLCFRSLNLLGSYHVSAMDARHILVRCALSHDLNRMHRHGTYYVNTKPLRMWKWESGFRPGHESPLALIWIAFPSLPIEFWGDLKSFASVFGKPIQLDKATSDLIRPLSPGSLLSLMRENPTLMRFLSPLVGNLASNNLWLLKRDLFTVHIVINWVTPCSFVISNILSLGPKTRFFKKIIFLMKANHRSPYNGW